MQTISERRKRKQRGVEVIEFALLMTFLMPPFLWMFISGINFVRFNKANDVARATALMYIKGLDFNQIGNQQLVARLASGLDLQVTDTAGSSLASTLGSGLVILTNVRYIGTSCNGCANQNQYVITQRIYMGNQNLSFVGTDCEGNGSLAGTPTTAIWDSTTGNIANYSTDTRARVASAFSTLWGSALGDGQNIFMVETFFKQLTFGAAEYSTSGVYTRVFM